MDGLRSLIFEMDSTLGAISSRVETIYDIERRFGQLRDSIDTAQYRGEQRIFNQDDHVEVRILSELLYYSVKDLREESDKAYKLHESMFNNVIKGTGAY
ncbi:hypothetical protein [Gorillibacterium sp. CAU 1737]|uniref:hypothetical protein n=1 Tax=Gorillibacterium sp. CAU 1737 TaxID=3140362 RepID=UPI00326131B6